MLPLSQLQCFMEAAKEWTLHKTASLRGNVSKDSINREF
jgi:hypothetical protein